jgi:hypothetical protein
MEEIKKEKMVKRETKEYITKDKTTEEMVEVKYNHLSVLVMRCL